MINYRPLLDCLTIKKSDIEGLGLFATKNIPKGTILGISHHVVDDQIVRTPLGGFYNHADKANCHPDYEHVNADKIREGNVYLLVTTRDIYEDEEILVNYTFYKP